jgi:hypothetical protein
MTSDTGSRNRIPVSGHDFGLDFEFRSPVPREGPVILNFGAGSGEGLES